MQSMISLDLMVAVSESGFSLDELVVRVHELSKKQGLPGIVSCVLRLVDEMLALRHMKASCWPGESCCERPRYQSLGFQERELSTGVGLVKFSWRRYQCQQCGKVRVPLREFLGLEPHQSHTNELEQVVVEVASEQSYRRSVNHLQSIGNIPVPRSTAHRWVVQTEANALEPASPPLQTLIADGTGFKRRPDPAQGLDDQGQLRMAVGITADGQVKALGTWSGKSWQEIAAALRPTPPAPNEAAAPEPPKLAKMLVSDGEPGLAEALGALTEDQQRCQWHMTHDLDVPMRRDGVGKHERRGLQKELAGLLKIELPAQDGQPVRQEDRQQVQEAMQAAEQSLNDFFWKLSQRGYRQAATYVWEAKKRLFGYVRFWLKHGVISPRVSSFIERLMREVARRLKRIAFGWRPENAAKMTRLVLKRVTDPDEWDKYWRKKLRLDGNVLIAYRGVHTSTPPTLGR